MIHGKVLAMIKIGLAVILMFLSSCSFAMHAQIEKERGNRGYAWQPSGDCNQYGYPATMDTGIAILAGVAANSASGKNRDPDLQFASGLTLGLFVVSAVIGWGMVIGCAQQ